MLEPAMQLLYGFYQSAKIFRQGCYWKHFWNTSRVTFPGIINIVVWLGRLVSGGFRRQQGALLTGVRDIQVGAEPSQTSLCKGTKSSVIGENSLQLATFSSGTPLPPPLSLTTQASASALNLHKHLAQLLWLNWQVNWFKQMINSVRKHELECWTKPTRLFNWNRRSVQKDKK